MMVPFLILTGGPGGGDSLYNSAPRGVDSKGVAPSNTAVKPGPSGMANSSARSDLRGREDSPHPEKLLILVAQLLKLGMRCPSGAMDTSPSSTLNAGDDSLYPSSPGFEGVDSESVTSHGTVVPPGCAVHQVKVLILKLLVAVPQVWCTTCPQKF